MICFHHDDMDGYCSAAIVMKETSCYDTNKFIVVTHDKEKDKEKFYNVINNGNPKEDTIYIVDYSFTEETKDRLIGLLEKGFSVVWIDHHDSSVKLIEDHPELKPNSSDYSLRGLISKEGSGAYLTYKYLHKPQYDDKRDMEVPLFIQLVSDYDTFANKIPDSSFFKLGIEPYLSLPKIYERFDVFIRQLRNLSYNSEGKNILNVDCMNIINKGKIIKDYIDGDNRYNLDKYGYESQLEDGTKIYCINREGNSWIFGDKYDEYDAVVLYAFDGEKYKYSMYSHDCVYNCGKYAESKGGGGHAGASGWESTELMFKKNN